MDFDYSEEQRQLQQQARRFLEDRCPPSAVRAVLANPELSFDRGLWAGLAQLGWLGTVIPEVHGGLGLGYVELCAIAEELGRAVAPVPLASTLYFIYEVSTHLRGEAGRRQVEGARIGLTHVVGLGSACAVHILEKARPSSITKDRESYGQNG